MPLELQPGDVYAGNIRVLDVLGSGNFAVVYKVAIPGHEHPLALKLTREPVSAGDEAQRALREITILRSLTNPHVPRTFDCGLRADGHIYLLMDYLDGLALDEWHDFEEPLHPAQAVAIIHQACLGLAEPHAKGIVHRDVKPENLFIERDGHVRVIDFGLARSWDGTPVIGTSASQTHMLIGTPHYAQPEQLESPVLSPAADVYSLAVILYELLAARSPFHPELPLNELKEQLRHRPLEWVKAHVELPVVPLEGIPGLEGLPEALVRGVNRALDKDPRRRIPDASAFANLLGLVLHRDMNVPVAGALRILHPDGTMEDRMFLPGSYRLGTGDRCEIKLRDDGLLKTHAMLDWSGMPHRPHLRPVAGDGSVRVNDDPIHRPAVLGPEDEFSIGRYRMAVKV